MGQNELPVGRWLLPWPAAVETAVAVAADAKFILLQPGEQLA